MKHFRFSLKKGSQGVGVNHEFKELPQKTGFYLFSLCFLHPFELNKSPPGFSSGNFPKLDFHAEIWSISKLDLTKSTPGKIVWRGRFQ